MLVDKFNTLGSNVSSTRTDIDTSLTKVWTAIDRLSVIWKSELTDRMKRSLFQATVVSIPLYGCPTGTLIKWMEKKLDGNYTKCCEQYQISPRDNTRQSSSYTATYLPSRKLSKLDEPDMQDTAGEAGTSSWVIFSYGPHHMAEQKQSDQLEPTHTSSVRIWDVALRTCQKRWMIERSGERGSGISMLMARQDDDDDDDDDGTMERCKWMH